MEKFVKIILAVSFFLALGSVSLASNQIGGPVEDLGVTATIEPCMAVSVITIPAGEEVPGDALRTNQPFRETGQSRYTCSLEFKALKRPGVVDADRYIVIIVFSNCSHWSVVCSTEGLESEDDFIPPERLYVKSYYTDPSVDEGAGPGYESLSTPKVIAKGGTARGFIYKSYYRMKATWEDRPGSYDGLLKLTVLPEP